MPSKFTVSTQNAIFSTEFVSNLLRNVYGLDTVVSALPGELDLNFMVRNSTDIYIFKIANCNEKKENLLLQHAVMGWLSRTAILQSSQVVQSVQGEEILELPDGDGKVRYARLLSWIEGKVFARCAPHSADLLFQLGKTLGKISHTMQGFDHPAAHRFMKWDPQQADWVKTELNRFTGERKELAEYFYNLFESEVLPRKDLLRKGVNYNDANDYNVLVRDEAEGPVVPGVIDFGDVVHTYIVNELAVALAYALMGKADPLEAAKPIISGYHSVFSLTELEMACLFPLMTSRLLISVTCSELNRADFPENTYLQISDKPAWDLLQKLKCIHPVFAHSVIRESCGLTPHPERLAFDEWCLKSDERGKFFLPLGNYSKSLNPDWLDLGVSSVDLGSMSDITDPVKLEDSVRRQMHIRNTDLLMGRYDEVRAIYTTDDYRVEGNDGPAWRSTHIGLDFFCKPGTPVVAIFDGQVHSFKDNAHDRDYGPTIILEHHFGADRTFYSLYGHLSRHSLEDLREGMKISAGTVIGAVGSRMENGGWPPHLHLQLMLDTLGNRGDFPGVCTPLWSTVYKSICPDPWKVLTGNDSPELHSQSKEEIVSYRRKHLGKNMSISYRDPLIMLRGDRQFLIDHTGRRYLDTVNNVAHVGHENPRVVHAGQRQMAVLNTNTRYLHPNLVSFTEELLSTMPQGLDVAFLVNSGSEANELAVRLAKTYTGQRDMIVSQVGYHGNTNVCVEISSYKFDGPGGTGAQPHIHVVPIPDTYRGLYRYSDPEAGLKYAAHVGGAVARVRQEGRGIAAFIFESVISCGGQVELPDGFLKESYRMVRAAGGVCIADEVQTGCGRAGSHYWAFEPHGVTPDIVTIGKPIGNGHPLGVVVTTQAIADAFKNGMEYFNTFGGNPVSCAIGREVLRIVKEEGLQQQAFVVGKYLKDGLRSLQSEFPIIGDVRGPGLFIGFELVNDPDTRKPAANQASWFANRMRDNGILMGTDGPFNNVLKIKPPMVFSKSDADFLLESTRKVLGEDRMKI